MTENSIPQENTENPENETSRAEKKENSQLADFLAEIKKLKSLLSNKDSEIENLKKELSEKNAGYSEWIAEKKMLMNKISALEQEKNDILSREKIRQVVTGKGGNWKLLAPLFENRVDVKEYGMFMRGTTKSVEEYLDELASDPDFAPAFATSLSKGGNITGKPDTSAKTISDMVDNPFSRDKPNLTKQVELFARDPNMALRLAKAAGNVPEWLKRRMSTSFGS